MQKTNHTKVYSLGLTPIDKEKRSVMIEAITIFIVWLVSICVVLSY